MEEFDPAMVTEEAMESPPPEGSTGTPWEAGNLLSPAKRIKLFVGKIDDKVTNYNLDLLTEVSFLQDAYTLGGLFSHLNS